MEYSVCFLLFCDCILKKSLALLSSSPLGIATAIRFPFSLHLRLNYARSLRFFSYMKHHDGPPLDSVQYVNIFLVLRSLLSMFNLLFSWMSSLSTHPSLSTDPDHIQLIGVQGCYGRLFHILLTILESIYESF